MAPVMKLANKDCYGTTAHVLSMFKDEETMNIIRTKMGILIFFLERKQKFAENL